MTRNYFVREKQKVIASIEKYLANIKRVKKNKLIAYLEARMGFSLKRAKRTIELLKELGELKEENEILIWCEEDETEDEKDDN